VIQAILSSFSPETSDSDKQIHSFRSYDSLRCASQTPLNLPPAPPCFHVVASCNGLLCLWDEMRDAVYIWNPATSSELKALPAAPSRRLGEPRPTRQDLMVYGVGFGFDSVSNDFKVVKLVDEDNDELLEAKMYSLKSGCWRLLHMSVNFRLCLSEQGPTLDGVFLWYNYQYLPYLDDRIVAFDFSEEEFVMMMYLDASIFNHYDEADSLGLEGICCYDSFSCRGEGIYVFGYMGFTRIWC
jgi:F-box interacting protein